MQRHITDHPKTHLETPRFRAYLAIDRQKKRHRVYDVLHCQYKASGSETAVVKFCEIARGYDA